TQQPTTSSDDWRCAAVAATILATVDAGTPSLRAISLGVNPAARKWHTWASMPSPDIPASCRTGYAPAADTPMPPVEAAASRRPADRISYRANNGVDGSVSDVTVSISITLDDELGEELNAAVAGSNRSAFVADAIRDYLDRRAVAAAAAWHASLEGEDAAVFAEFNAPW